MTQEEIKKEASGRMSIALEMMFATLGALEVTLGITSSGDVVVIDNKTGLSSTFTSEKFQETYDKWAKKNNV